MMYSDLYGRWHDARQSSAEALSALWNLRFSRWYIAVLAILQATAWVQAVYIFKHLSGDLLVRHYNVDFGIDLVGAPAEIFYYPVFGLLVGIFNIALAAAGRRRPDFRALSHLFLAGAAAFAFFLNLALLFVYLINFR